MSGDGTGDRRLLHRYAVGTAGVTFVLLIAGGLVTSTDSGLAVPDWPLSYGTWFPPMVGGILFEHGHRMIAGVVALMILALAGWLRLAEPRRWVQRLGYTALGGVILQALLGGLTVLWLLPPAISIAHACLGPAVFCLIVCVAWGTAPGWSEAPARCEDGGRLSLRALGLAVATLTAAQLLSGAVVRHTGIMVWLHLVGAAVLLVMAVWLGRRLKKLERISKPLEPRGRGLPQIHTRIAADPRSSAAAIGDDLRPHRVRLHALLGAQLVLGLVVLAHRSAVGLRTAHAALGSFLLAQAVVLAWEIARRALHTRSDLNLKGWRDYVELTKPRLSSLVLVTTAVGFWLGLREPEALARLVPVLFGTALVVGGANALNQWMEREPDALMERTRHRPLPAGRLAPNAAFRFGLVLSILGFTWLILSASPLSTVLVAIGWASYLFIYTPMKRVSPLCTLAGAIPGALPPMIGWAGSRGTLDPGAWALFGILFIWQLPHFLALAVLYREDYARAGIPVLPLVEAGGLITARQIVLSGMALLPVSLFPTIMGLASETYFYGAMLLGLGFFVVAARTAWLRSLQSARQLFQASVIYLPALLGLLALNRTPLK